MKKSLLKNPLIVALLVIIAVGFIFVNNILPYMKSDEIPEETTTDDTIAQQDMADTQVVESESLLQDGTQPVSHTSSLTNNLLKTQGWIRTTSRDPFENARSETENEMKSDVSNSISMKKKSDNVAVGNVVKKVIIKPPVKVPNLLKAISIGTAEKVALIGSSVCHEGDTCSLGVVKKIDPDSVIIIGSKGIRILHLK